MKKSIVVAIGGNAIIQSGQQGTYIEQFSNIDSTCKHIAHMVKSGYEVVITHGNGPQVGNILIQNEEARNIVPPMTLDICGAESQGLIGYMIQQSLAKHLKSINVNKKVITVITQVLVDKDDPAFDNPSKPIGPFYNKEQAEELIRTKGFAMKEDSGRGWRRVFPSPQPKLIIESEAITSLINDSFIVIASGGGGIPIIYESGEIKGIEAVVDKDLAAQRLAADIKANILLILTDVPNIYINYGTPNQKKITVVRAEKLRKYQERGHFKPGSMGPKVEATLRFVESGGEMAIITSLENAFKAIQNEVGSRIIP